MRFSQTNMADEKKITSRKAKTVIIEKKNQKTGAVTSIVYAKVTDRVAELHKDSKTASIQTEYKFDGDYCIFTAKVIPHAEKPERFFTGTSLGKMGAEKALEKLETLAVGRALAFAGYLSGGEIASAEEMEKYNQKLQVDSEIALKKINATKNLEELKKVWLSISEDERNNDMVFRAKEIMKDGFEANQVEPDKEPVIQTEAPAEAVTEKK